MVRPRLVSLVSYCKQNSYAIQKYNYCHSQIGLRSFQTVTTHRYDAMCNARRPRPWNHVIVLNKRTWWWWWWWWIATYSKRPCGNWQMYDDGSVLSHRLAMNTNCSRLLSYSTTAKRAKVSIWPCTSPPAESNVHSCYCSECMEVSVRAAAAEIIAADFYAAPTDSPLPKKFGSSCRQQDIALIVCWLAVFQDGGVHMQNMTCFNFITFAKIKWINAKC